MELGRNELDRRRATEAQLGLMSTGGRRQALLAQLARWNTDFSREEIEDALQTATAKAYAGSCPALAAGQVYVWLRTTAHHEVSHQRRSRRREVLTEPNATVFETASPARSPERRLLEHEDELDRLLLAAEVSVDLSPRQRAVLDLYGSGWKRPQIADRLQLSPRVVKRELQRIMDVARATVRRLAGGGCPSGELAVIRLACSLASPSEAARAERHIAACPHCSTLREQLELWHDKARGAAIQGSPSPLAGPQR